MNTAMAIFENQIRTVEIGLLNETWHSLTRC